jgi:hypothetical protein
MKHPLRLPASAISLLLLLLLWGCSDESGSTGPGTGTARISGVLTGAGSGSSAALAGGETEGRFSGGIPLRGASVRLVTGEGRILFDSTTDTGGEFETVVPAGVYRLEFTLAGEEAFAFEITVDPDEHLFIRAQLRQAGPRFVLDAELFIDNDGDRASDSGFSIQIIGREAGRPESGEVRGGRDDEDEDDDANDEDGDDDDENDDDDEEVRFAVFLARVQRLGPGAFNHDVQGTFVDGRLRADKLAVSDEPRDEIEIIGEVQRRDLSLGTLTVLGITVGVDGTTDFKGGLGSLRELSDGSHVRVRAQRGAGGLVAREIQPANRRDDRLRGGTLAAAATSIGDAPEFTVSIGGSQVVIDVDSRTEFEIEN